MNPVLERAKWQHTLFALQPRRGALLSLTPQWPLRPVTFRVHRNHAFEPIERVLMPYLAFGGLNASFVYSDYDDSLNFMIQGDADAEILWLDTTHYQENIDFEAWLIERTEFLRSLSERPIFVGLLGARDLSFLEDRVPGTYIFNIPEIAEALGTGFFNERTAEISGTRLSNEACVIIAREMGCRWIPPLFGPTLKAIVFDLDQTLYSGVLAEDGVDGIILTQSHKDLQALATEFHRLGIFLAVCSRNEEQDVRTLFDRRKDFPLGWELFSAHEINWGDKAANILKVAEKLRIDVDAMLFVDDNPGELVMVSSSLPQLHVIHACEDVDVTVRSLKYYPGIWKWKGTESDGIRIADLAAAEDRNRLREKVSSPREYFEALQIQLTLFVNPRLQRFRIAEMSQKTNQFNLTFKRYDEVAVEFFLSSEDYCVVTILLRDRLSDSGVICLIVGRKEGSVAVIEELCVSCRALGRGIESIMIANGCSLVLDNLKCHSLRFPYQRRDRNAPALDWLAGFSETSLSERGTVVINDLYVPPSDGVKLSLENVDD